MGDGDGWIHCELGHRHWGRFGAAGVLVTDGASVLLAHRAAWTHQGGSWAVPGGARDSHETPVMAALRELGEETSFDPSVLVPFGEWIDDHHTWRYTTVLAWSEQTPPVVPLEQLFRGQVLVESDDVRWWPVDQVDTLRLHYGFAGAWPHLRARIADGPPPGTLP